LNPIDNPPPKSPRFSRLFGRSKDPRPAPPGSEVRRLEEKRRALQQATDQWLSLLREMEQQGHSGHADYERYHAAYSDAKKQLNEIDLALFNVRTSK